MKVNYEFNIDENNDDRNELLIYQNAFKFYMSLLNISDYMRELNKGWKDHEKEEMIDNILEILSESNMHEVE